jgi:hypothetical protein
VYLSHQYYDAPLENCQGGMSAWTLGRCDDFHIQITNPAFSYDPNTNTVSVTPGSEVKHVGEMSITWKSRPMEFSSVPIRRTIPLYWDNLKDGYIIAPFTNGGSYVPFHQGKYEQRCDCSPMTGQAGVIFLRRVQR